MTTPTEVFKTLTDRELGACVKAGLANLSENDRGFAIDILASVRRQLEAGGVASDKQRACLIRLAATASGQVEERATTAVGDLSGLMAIFDKARGHLKAPAIVIGLAGESIRLSVAPDTARVPGSVNVGTAGDYESRKWFGRILAGGVFEASPREPTPEGLTAALQAFAADPAGVAAAHGRLTGRCCFCNLPLTDERSTMAGYGKKCSENYELPYPTAKAAKAAGFACAA